MRDSIVHQYATHAMVIRNIKSVQYLSRFKRQPILHKFLCFNASFFSTNDEVTREQRQQLTQAEEIEILLFENINIRDDTV